MPQQTKPLVTLQLLDAKFLEQGKFDARMRAKVTDTLVKLTADPTAPGLHVEPIENAADKRLRSIRVDGKYRMLAFKLAAGAGIHFVVVGVFNHDDAYARAGRMRLGINPVNGIAEILDAGSGSGYAVAESERKARAARRAAEEQAKREAEEHAAERSAAREAALSRAQAASASARAASPNADAETESAGVEAASHEASVSARTGAARAHEPSGADIAATAEELAAGLGLDEKLSARVLATDSLDGLIEVLDELPAWMAGAYLSLAEGAGIEQVRADLDLDGLASEQGEAGDDEDARLISGLKSAAVQQDMRVVGESGAAGDELREELEEALSAPFDDWRVYLHSSQRQLVDRNFKGSARVTGGAGTGKTVVAVHRADRLVRERDDEGRHPRVLLTTFTTTLAESLKNLMNLLDPAFPEAGEAGEPGLWIAGIDQLALWVVRTAPDAAVKAAFEKVLGTPVSGRPGPLEGRMAERLWREAIDLSGEGIPAAVATAQFMSDEYEDVVIGGAVTSLAGYRRAPRPGRGTPLGRAQRGRVWDVMQTFQRKCVAENRYPWAVIGALAAELMPEEGLFDHAVVDEAQDFHAGHWRFLRAAVRPGANDIFFAEDSHQRIYGQRLVLERFGIRTRGRASAKLRLNYRTTRENLDYAVQMLAGEEWIDSAGEADELGGYRSERTGPAPEVLVAASAEEELDLAAEAVRGWCAGGGDVHVGVLVRTNRAVSQAEQGLAERLEPEGIEVVGTRNAAKASNASAVVMTMHSAKGMEFNHVVLMGMDDGQMPLHWAVKGLGEHEKAEQLQRERALLYVAASRARESLLITSTGRLSGLVPC